MEYRPLGRTGVQVSKLCLGTMMFGAWGNPDHDDSIRIIHAALDAGVNFVDTADVYSAGESEEIVGKALKGRRDDVVLATKFFMPMGDDPNRRGGSRRWIVRAVEDSLRRLGTDWIDLYQVHRPDPAVDVDETLGALTDLVRQGKVRSIGSSSFSGSEIVEAQWTAREQHLERFRTEQPPYSLLVRGILIGRPTHGLPGGPDLADGRVRNPRRRPAGLMSAEAGLEAEETGATMQKSVRFSRRAFVAWVGGASAGFYLFGRSPGTSAPEALAQIPGGTLDPADVPKFQTPLLIPPVMPRAATITMRGGKPADYYEISMRQLSQQILPAGLPATTVWGYGAVRSASRRGLLLHHAPSLTIEASWKRPVRIKWINELVNAEGGYLPHLLPVDPTLHWANPPGGTAGRDMRPTFDSTPGRYTGPVPIVTHLHGAAGVGDESDGYAEAWYLPAATNIPAGYATEGTWYDFFSAKATSKFGVAWGPGFATFQYPNDQRESTLWYHDHTLGMTRLNVYAGPAGFFLVRGGPDGDKAVLDSRSGTTAVLPGPAPNENDAFPPNKTYYEIPIAIQDRSFNGDGSLFYPDTRAFFDGIAGPYIPDTDLSPIWNPEFFGNMIMVNGSTWPFQTVEQRRYRLRFLNGCQSRFLILDFSSIPGVEVWQIGNEGGFLAAPVNLTADNGNRLLMGLAERADMIVDFTNVPVADYVLANVGPDEPFGGGAPDEDFDAADPASTGQVLQFRVVPAVAPDPTTPPRFLVLPAITRLAGGTSRPLALLEHASEFFEDAPAEAELGTIAVDPTTGTGTWTAQGWEDPVTENPAVGATELWELYNATADAHPMHIHEVAFQVVNRQAIAVDEASGTVQVQPGSAPIPPEPWEQGWKDTVVAYPGQVTRLRLRFTNAGQFVWHCHIVEHEDNEMMRAYRIGPPQPGQPG